MTFKSENRTIYRVACIVAAVVVTFFLLITFGCTPTRPQQDRTPIQGDWKRGMFYTGGSAWQTPNNSYPAYKQNHIVIDQTKISVYDTNTMQTSDMYDLDVYNEYQFYNDSVYVLDTYYDSFQFFKMMWVHGDTLLTFNQGIYQYYHKQ